MSLLFPLIHLPYLTTTTIATSATSSSASGGGTMELLLQHLYNMAQVLYMYVRNTTLYNVPAMLTTNCLFRRYSLTQCCKFTFSYGTVVMSNYASFVLQLNSVYTLQSNNIYT